MAREALIDFRVTFDSSTSIFSSPIASKNSFTLGSTANNTQSLRCDSDWLITGESVNYTYYDWDGQDDIEKIVGVALNGVPIRQSLSEAGYDPLFPQAYGKNTNPKRVQLDNCLGNFMEGGFYHYYSATPCLTNLTYASQKRIGQLCTNESNCSSNITTYIQKYIGTKNFTLGKRNIVGIARDGRFILHPINPATNKPWQPCEVDACNLVDFEGEGESYAMTMFHPYTVGCWGPGAKNKFAGQCTSQSKTCNSFCSRLCLSAVSSLQTAAYWIAAISLTLFISTV